MVLVVPLATSTIEQWTQHRTATELFFDDSIFHLQNLIVADHFMVVVTIMRGDLPFSLVFRSQKTILPAGRRLRAEYEAKGELSVLSKRFHHRPIQLAPLTDQPIISMQGKEPCSFNDAMKQAQTLVKWTRCPLIYVFDGDSRALRTASSNIFE
jgi:hypothetical protein